MKQKILSLAVLAAALAGFAQGAAAADSVPTINRIDMSGMNGTQQTFDRFIIKYRNGSRTAASSAAVTQAVNAATHRTFLRAGSVQPNAQVMRRLSASGAHVLRMTRKLDRTESQNLMIAIAADPDVEYIVPDVLRQVTAEPTDPLYKNNQWHFNNPVGGVNLQPAWDAGATGAGVVVAVLDTGVTQHSDLAANLLPGYDFIYDAATSGRATDGRVAGGWDLGDWLVANQCGAGSPAKNSSWHGTHVTGTVAEVTNNGIGMAGVAPNAKVVPLRVLGHCGGWDSDIIDAITWASGGSVAGMADNPNPAEVINMSLGGISACPAPWQEAINGAVARGVTVVVAAGNDGTDAQTHMPANCENVITVGSTGVSGKRAGYSNYGARVDIAAPGGGVNDGTTQQQGYVFSAWNAGTTTPAAETYAGMVGTSMAAPHVAGIVALLQSVDDRKHTPAEVEALLKQSARPFPTLLDRPLGVGIVDAGTAILVHKTGGSPLGNGAVKAGLVGGAGESFVYVLSVGENVSRLTITSYGGSGQVKLFARRAAEPTATDFDAQSLRPGNNQLITINAPVAGTYFVKVTGVSAFSGLSLKAAWQ